MNGAKPAYRDEADLLDESATPTAVDWRKKGAVTKVKDQLACGSCWAFSTTGALEGLDFIHNGKLNSLSEQQLVDCSDSQGKNQGCDGGEMTWAFDYVEKTPLTTEDNYPYFGKYYGCMLDPTEKGVGTLTSYTNIAKDEPDQLKAAIAQSPTSILIAGSSPAFMSYHSGILDDPSCGEKQDHGVLAVGYGEGYFIVKNSWGADWGEKGYIRVSDSKANICGILSGATLPSLK